MLLTVNDMAIGGHPNTTRSLANDNTRAQWIASGVPQQHRDRSALINLGGRRNTWGRQQCNGRDPKAGRLQKRPPEAWRCL